MAFSADSIDLGDLKLGRTRTLMTLDQSRAVFALREVRARFGHEGRGRALPIAVAKKRADTPLVSIE